MVKVLDRGEKCKMGFIINELQNLILCACVILENKLSLRYKIESMESNEKFDALEKKLDALAMQVAKGFDFAEKKFDAIETKINDLRGGSEANLGGLEKEIKEGFAGVVVELKKINVATRYEHDYEYLKKQGEA